MCQSEVLEGYFDSQVSFHGPQTDIQLRKSYLSFFEQWVLLTTFGS